MKGSAKLMVAGLIAALAVAIGYRELTRAPAPVKDDHGHAHAPAKSTGTTDPHGHDHDHDHGVGGEGFVKLTPTQIEAAGIDMAPAASGTLTKEITVPGRISLNAERQAKVVPRLAGIVAKVDKKLGEQVAENEVLAVLERKEMADAKAEYLAAWRAEECRAPQQTASPCAPPRRAPYS